MDPDPLPLEIVPSPSPTVDVAESAPPQARPQRTAQPATLFDIEADDTPPPLSRELQDALAYRDPALVKQRAQHEREDEQQQRTRRGAKPAATVADSAGITTPEPDVFSSVSYTHLDVYKRQNNHLSGIRGQPQSRTAGCLVCLASGIVSHFGV